MKELIGLVPLLLLLYSGCAGELHFAPGLHQTAVGAGRLQLQVQDLFRDPALQKKCIKKNPLSETFQYEAVSAGVYVPANYRNRVMILLPGWRHPRSSWQRHSVLFQLAEQFGVALVMPEMGRANYMTRWYPETRAQMKWRGGMPSLLWIGRVLLPWIRVQFGTAELYVAGYSTGARGAMMSATRYPVFAGAGYLSGDWDLVTDQGMLYQWALGPMTKFPCRWRRDNSKYLAYRLGKTRIFAAHSLQDRVTPADQTEMMIRDLQVLGVPHRLELDKDGGHDWSYWNRKFKAMFRWFFADGQSAVVQQRLRPESAPRKGAQRYGTVSGHARPG